MATEDVESRLQLPFGKVFMSTADILDVSENRNKGKKQQVVLNRNTFSDDRLRQAPSYVCEPITELGLPKCEDIPA